VGNRKLSRDGSQPGRAQRANQGGRSPAGNAGVESPADEVGSQAEPPGNGVNRGYAVGRRLSGFSPVR
jgi:hypothetical protein